MLLVSFDGFSRDWTRGDVIAGLTVWAVLVPESLAYASIAGAKSQLSGVTAALLTILTLTLFATIDDAVASLSD
jgi:sulfate permease, SulP family